MYSQLVLEHSDNLPTMGQRLKQLSNLLIDIFNIQLLMFIKVFNINNSQIYEINLGLKAFKFCFITVKIQ